MKIEDFTSDSGIESLVRRTEDYMHGKTVSNIVDASGNQYIDLVMEAAGVLGIALVGYTYLLERVGIRFLCLGGTSAGAVNALLLAAVGPVNEPKSEKLVSLLADLDLEKFIDGDDDARKLLRTLIDPPGRLALLRGAYRSILAYDSIEESLGLNPGDHFLNWLMGVLGRYDITCSQQIEKRLLAVPESLSLRDGTPVTAASARARLAMIAADVSTETRVEFPRMAELYWRDPGAVNPAKFARACMSTPFLFQPYRVTDIPCERSQAWQKAYPGAIPDNVLLVDGGLVANFPIDLFHTAGVPDAPTFGARVAPARHKPRDIKGPLDLVAAVYNSARQCLHYGLIRCNDDYSRLVANIDSDGHSGFNFYLSDDAKVDLFRRGASAAAEFLKTFDWAGYREVRASLGGPASAGRPEEGTLMSLDIG